MADPANPGQLAPPDGQVDFQFVRDAQGRQVIDPATNAPVRRVRWYGFPRDTNDDGAVNARDDVVPFQQFAGVAAGFERLLPQHGTGYAGYDANDSYVVAFGPDTGTVRPSMIRVTITVDDNTPGAARIAAGQTFEYVFNLQQ